MDSHGSRRGTSLDVQRGLSSGSRGHQGKPLELSTTLTSLTDAGMQFPGMYLPDSENLSLFFKDEKKA